MKLMEFKHKDVYVKVHTPLVITRKVEVKGKLLREELIFAEIIDIDSRVQAVFAQVHHSKKNNENLFSFVHAPRIGEKNYDKSVFYSGLEGKYKHLSIRQNETFVSGVIVNVKALERQKDGFVIFAWDGDIKQKLYWAIDHYYDTPFLEEWTDFLLQKLIDDKWLLSLTVHDFTGDYSDLLVYELKAEDKDLDIIISEAIKAGQILMNDESEVV